MEWVPGLGCFVQEIPSPGPCTKDTEIPMRLPEWWTYLLGGVLAWRSLLLASRGSPGLAGSGVGAVVLGACGGAGGGAGFFTIFSLT